MKKAALEWADTHFSSTLKGAACAGYMAGWQACASRPLAEAEVEAMVDAFHPCGVAELSMRSDEDGMRAAYAALSRLRGGP